jgi:ribose transport system substrate-binding protein
MKKFLMVTLVAVAVATLFHGQPQHRYRIAVVPMTNTHAFFQTIKAGAEKAAKELGVQVLWRGPESETDVAGQIAIMENFIAQKVDAIVLAPCERKALVPVVQKAQKQGIVVVVVDSALELNIADCFIATDNFKGGYIAGETLAKLIGYSGKVGVVQAIPGAASVQEREQGFREALKKFPKVKIASVLYGQSSVATTMQAAENMLTAHPDLKGIFAVNEISGVGTAQVLRARKLAGKVKLVAFDASETEIQALRDGIIQALIVQNPFRMGELGVRYAVMKLQGKPIPKRIDTGVTVVTKENFDKPEIQRLLFPLRKR